MLTARLRSLRAEERERGITVVEVVVVMSLLSIVMAVILSTLWQAQRGEAYTRGRTAALDEMRISLNRMTKDLRQVYEINGTPTATYLDVDTYVDGVPAQVVFDMSGGTLRRTVNGGSPSIVQSGLTNGSIFTYTPDATSPNLVTITFQTKPSNLPDTTLTLEAEITFRNR